MKVSTIARNMLNKLDAYENNTDAIFSAYERKRDINRRTIAFFTPLKDYGATNERDQRQWMP